MAANDAGTSLLGADFLGSPSDANPAFEMQDLGGGGRGVGFAEELADVRDLGEAAAEKRSFRCKIMVDLQLADAMASNPADAAGAGVHVSPHPFDVHGITSAASLRIAIGRRLQLPTRFTIKELAIVEHDGSIYPIDDDDADSWQDVLVLLPADMTELLTLRVLVGSETSMILCSDTIDNDEGKELPWEAREQQSGAAFYRLTVHVKRGRDLAAMDRSGTSDPFIQCSVVDSEGDLIDCSDDGGSEKATPEGTASEGAPLMHGRSDSIGWKMGSKMKRRKLRKQYMKQTSVKKKNNSNPQWDEDLSFDIPCTPEQLETYQVRVEAFDHNRTGHKKIGSFMVPLPQIVESIAQATEDVSPDGDFDGDPSSGGGGEVAETQEGTWFTLMNTVSLKLDVGDRLARGMGMLRRRQASTEIQEAEMEEGEEEEEEEAGMLEIAFSLAEPDVDPEADATASTNVAGVPDLAAADTPGNDGSGGAGTTDQEATQYEQEPEPEPVAASMPLKVLNPLAPQSDGKLIVVVLRCSGLAPANKRNNSDAYAQLTLNGFNPQKTKVVKKTLNPEFNESKNLEILRGSDTNMLKLSFYDWEKVGTHDFLGEATLDLCAFFGPEGWVHGEKPVTLQIEDPNNLVNEKIKQQQLKSNKSDKLGQCHLKLIYLPGPKPISFPAAVQAVRTSNNLIKEQQQRQQRQQQQQQQLSGMPTDEPGTSAAAGASIPGGQLLRAPSAPDAGALVIKPCTVEVLLLGARELLSKPRKAQLLCEYLCKDQVVKSARFAIQESSLNPSFALSRQELERKSASGLRKLVRDQTKAQQSGGIDADELRKMTKEDLIERLLAVPQLKLTNVPFVYGSSTAIKITMLEKPLVSREMRPIGSTTITLADGNNASHMLTSQLLIDEVEWSEVCNAYINGVKTLCQSVTQTANTISFQRVDEWWSRRVRYNDLVAEKMLDGLIYLWWSIHSVDGRKGTTEMLNNLWLQLEDTEQSSTADVDVDGFPTQFVREIFTLKPAQACIDAIIATMDLGRMSTSAGRKISKHEAQRWWARNSVRSAQAFESVWSQADTLSGFLHESNLAEFVQLLLEPTAEDIRTVKKVLLQYCKEVRETPDESHEDRPMGGPPMGDPVVVNGPDGVQEWWKHRLTHLKTPLGKSELRSLLDDENCMTSWFEQQADGAGPAEQKYVDEELMDSKKEAEANSRINNALWNSISASIEETEDEAMPHIFGHDTNEDDITIDMGTEASTFDSSLSTFRTLHDYYNMDVPDPSERWRKFWGDRNMRFTSLRMQTQPHGTVMFDRENIEAALSYVLAVDEDLIQALWADLDADGSGLVDRDEAQHWWEENLPSHNQLRFDLAWTCADKDCSMTIEFDEAQSFINYLLRPTSKELEKIIEEMRTLSAQYIQDDESVAIDQRSSVVKMNEARIRQSETFAKAIEYFEHGLKILDSIDVHTDQRDALEVNMKDACNKAMNSKNKFVGETLEPWQIGRKYLKGDWESSTRGGMQSYFPRYILQTQKEVSKPVYTETESGTESETDTEALDALGLGPEMVNTGAIRCALQVSHEAVVNSGKQEAQDKQWEHFKASMEKTPMIVRVYVIDGSGLRAMGNGNSSSSYLVASLGKSQISRQKHCVKKSLNPEWREFFEFETVLPGPALLQIHVKHHQTFGKDKDIGITTIDLERRFFCEQWQRTRLQNVESRNLTAAGLKQHAKRYGHTGHGKIRLWVDIHPQLVGSPLPPPISIKKPSNESFQLRVIVWHAENIPTQGSLTKMNDMYFSSHLRTKVGSAMKEQRKETDTHWRAKNGRGNFNYRMLFDFDIDPRLPARKPCALTLKCWNKEPLRLTSSLIGYKEIDLSPMLTAALTERKNFLKRAQMADETFQVGNTVELERLLDNFRDQNREHFEQRDEQEKESSRERYRKSKVVESADARSGKRNKSSNKGCCSGASDLGSVLDNLTEEQEIDILKATQEYKDHNLRRFELTMNNRGSKRKQNDDDNAEQDDSDQPSPTVWATIEVIHKSLVDARPAGEGRDEPNENPVLEQPEREKIGFGNVMGSLSMLVGPKLAKKAKMLILMVLVLAMVVEIVPAVSSEFLIGLLRSGAIPLGCEAGFEKASNLYSTVCGVTVYGPYTEENDYTWDPPQQQNIIECLGPEVCPPFPCFENGIAGKRKKHDDDDWWKEHALAPHGGHPDLKNPGSTASNNEQLIQLTKQQCEAQEYETEFVGEYFLYNITGTKYRKAVDATISQMYYHGDKEYSSIDDLRLFDIASKRVQEKCQHGGNYYNLVHYGTVVEPHEYSGFACSKLRQGFKKDEKGSLILDKDNEDFWQNLRQDGIDGFIWRLFEGPGPCPTGKCNAGFLSTPMIFPWEECTASPCPRQCIDTSSGHVECPAQSDAALLKFVGRMLTVVIIPVLFLKIVWGCCEPRLRKALPALGLITRCRRRVRLLMQRNYRRCSQFGTVGKVLWFAFWFSCLYFFSQ